MDQASAQDPDAAARRLPVDRPCSRLEVADAGISERELAELVSIGAVRRVVRGVYADALVPDTLTNRLAALRLVVPESAVVVDSTAAWLHVGDRALAPGEHLQLQAPQVFDERRGRRLRRQDVRSGTRDLAAGDVLEIDGLRVTTPLRTAVDVARLQHPARALASLDCLLAGTDVQRDDLLVELGRFKGFRGIVRARSLAAWADPRSESYGESAVRYVWRITPGLPVPQLQVPVEVDGWEFRLDLADEDLQVAVEYDGREFHGPDREPYDVWRRGLLASAGWHNLVLRDRDVFGKHRQVESLLASAFRERRAARTTA